MATAFDSGESSPSGASGFDQDEFNFETKAVVLNFLGLLPAPTPPNSAQSSSSSSAASRQQHLAQCAQPPADANLPQSWKKELPDLPELSIMERFDPSQSEDELDEMMRSRKRQSGPPQEIPLSSAPGKIYTHSISVGDDSLSEAPLQSYLPQKSPVSPKKQASILRKWRTIEVGEHASLHYDKTTSPHKHKSVKGHKVDHPVSLPLREGAAAGDADFSPSSKSRISNGSFSDEHKSTEAPKKSPRPQFNPSPSRSEDTSKSEKSLLERQLSDLSDMSDDSLGFSESSSLLNSGLSLASVSSSYVSVQNIDVASLVRSNALPPIALPLREEITKELADLEKERVRRGLSVTPLDDDTDHSFPPATPGSYSHPHSPETQVADYLRIIGDRVNADYGPELDQAVRELQAMPREEITYDLLKSLARQLLEHMAAHSSGWSKVALLMLLGQRITFSLLSRGERGISSLVDNLARVIGDYAAEFIVSRGGWHSIAEIMTPISAGDFQPQFPLLRDDSSTTTPSADTTGTTVLHDSALSADQNGATTLQSSTTLESIASIINDGQDDVDTRLKKDSATQANLPHGVDSSMSEEIQLLRQASTDYMNEIRNETRQSEWVSLAIGAVGVVLISVCGMVIYKRYYFR